MSFCRHCGAQIPDGASFCPVCGTTAGQQSGTNPRWQYDSAADIKANKDICILCYFGPLLLIPYLTRKGSPFVTFHSNQGLVLLLFALIASVASGVPFLGWIIGLLCGIFLFICFIMGIVNVCNGEIKELPAIGKISILKQN